MTCWWPARLLSGSSLLAETVIFRCGLGGAGRSGFVAAISRSLEIQLGIAAVLFVLALALPRRPRDAEAELAAETEPDADGVPEPALPAR